MRIPKRFKLLGHTVDVMEDPSRMYESRAYGSCSYEAKWIKLVPPSPSHPVTQGSVEHTFMHELVHMCLYHTEHAELNENDAFVDLLAGLLHQALTTAEYEEEEA